MLKLLAYYNKDVHDVVMGNAPQNAKYTSPAIQKEILQVFADKVQKTIREEIGDSKFCVIVDESRDISKREQMAIVIRFIDRNGFLLERFFELVHVKDTTSKTLKEEISIVLSNHELSIQNLRGQGYDGASNMRGEWNGLRALFMRDCPYAYYVHCLAHQLELALIAAAREVGEVHDFFKDLIFIVNTVSSSTNRHDELQASQIAELEHLIEIEEVETGKGLNQIGTLQRPGDTRWSSHFKSICSLLRMFNATRSVLEKIAIDSQQSYAQRGDAKSALKKLLSFDFVFILHLMEDIMGFTDGLCRALQHKSQDILNAMHLVVGTKSLIQKLRDDGWELLLQKVHSFCNKHGTEIIDMQVSYAEIIRTRRNKDTITVEHHYRVNVFSATIDQQLQELNSRFSEQTTELLTLSESLSPIDGYKHFDVENICRLAEKYYPQDFSENEISHLKYQLELFYCDVPKHSDMKNLSTITALCRSLVENRKSDVYPLVDRLIRLILTLPVSTATSERAFSAMKIVKISLRTRWKMIFFRITC
ncbi:uncharacterized protein [Spinacia oleracea]|uniref:Zinc finger MYM-type protein 1-like n=1 Tax=Spinacia oleracea TaxID=3562 RepID=A0ABM3QQ68_SPIOL|nr:uncharacterized protein LOC130461429 [Spinacia oleracea]